MLSFDFLEKFKKYISEAISLILKLLDNEIKFHFDILCEYAIKSWNNSVTRCFKDRFGRVRVQWWTKPVFRRNFLFVVSQVLLFVRRGMPSDSHDPLQEQ